MVYNMRSLCLIFLVGCVSANHLDQFLVYSHPDEPIQQIQDSAPTTIIESTTGRPVVSNPLPALIVPQNQPIDDQFFSLLSTSSTETPASPANIYVIPAVTELEPATFPSVTEGVTDSVNDFITETLTQLATGLTDTVTQTVTFIQDFSTLIVTDYETITAPATVLTSTVVQRVPQSTVTVTHIQEAQANPLIYTVTQASFITVTQTRPHEVTQTLPLPNRVHINHLKNKYVTVTRSPLFFGKSADPTPSPSDVGEGEFLIIKPAGPIVPVNEVPAIVDISNDGVAKSLDNNEDEKIAESIIPLEEVPLAINVAIDNLGKSLDDATDDENAEVTTEYTPTASTTESSYVSADVSFSTATPEINAISEKFAKSLDTDADDLFVEVTTRNASTESTTHLTSVSFDVTTTATATIAPVSIPAPIVTPTIAPAVARPKAISFLGSEDFVTYDESVPFLGSEDVVTYDESIPNDVIEILRGNLVYALTDNFRLN